jgi:hypothetical protein
MRLLLAAFVAFALASDADAQTSDPLFTITVPVELRNLPTVITRYRVSCTVNSPKEQIATGSTDGTFSGGSFIGDAIVEARRATAFADPTTATGYRCSLHLTGSDGRVYMSDSAVQFPRADGAPYRRTVRGSLPR